MDLPAVSYLVACAGYDVKCAEYASFGTEELAFNAYQAMKNRKAVLLANHGLLAGAKDIKNAYNIAEQIELCCEIYYRAKSIGEPVLLDQQEMDRNVDERSRTRQKVNRLKLRIFSTKKHVKALAIFAF